MSSTCTPTAGSNLFADASAIKRRPTGRAHVRPVLEGHNLFGDDTAAGDDTPAPGEAPGVQCKLDPSLKEQAHAARFFSEKDFSEKDKQSDSAFKDSSACSMC